jgi:hypothetical protein
VSSSQDDGRRGCNISPSIGVWERDMMWALLDTDMETLCFGLGEGESLPLRASRRRRISASSGSDGLAWVSARGMRSSSEESSESSGTMKSWDKSRPALEMGWGERWDEDAPAAALESAVGR